MITHAIMNNFKRLGCDWVLTILMSNISESPQELACLQTYCIEERIKNLLSLFSSLTPLASFPISDWLKSRLIVYPMISVLIRLWSGAKRKVLRLFCKRKELNKDSKVMGMKNSLEIFADGFWTEFISSAIQFRGQFIKFFLIKSIMEKSYQF